MSEETIGEYVGDEVVENDMTGEGMEGLTAEELGLAEDMPNPFEPLPFDGPGEDVDPENVWGDITANNEGDTEMSDDDIFAALEDAGVELQEGDQVSVDAEGNISVEPEGGQDDTAHEYAGSGEEMGYTSDDESHQN